MRQRLFIEIVKTKNLEKLIVLKVCKMVGEPLGGMRTKKRSTSHQTLEETLMRSDCLIQTQET